MGKNEGRGAGLVAGTGEPGRVLLGGGRLPGRCRNGRAGAVLLGAARWRAKK